MSDAETDCERQNNTSEIMNKIKIFEYFWGKRDKNFTPRNWAISAFHLGMEVQNQKAPQPNTTVRINEKPCAKCEAAGYIMGQQYCPRCGQVLHD